MSFIHAKSSGIRSYALPRISVKGGNFVLDNNGPYEVCRITTVYALWSKWASCILSLDEYDGTDTAI